MTDFLRLIIEIIQFIWPFKVVAEWEQGVWLTFGRYWKTVGPGTYLSMPFFMDMHLVNVVPGMIVTPRLDITLLDGSTVSLVASAWHKVVDAQKAVVTVEEFETTSNELLQAVVADRVSRVKPERLEPENRAALLRDLTGWAAQEAAEYGIEFTKVRFSTFVLRARTYRLIGDH
jgi:regulator of protease activity HflC (stomatin/prohibitin superfamily)